MPARLLVKAGLTHRKEYLLEPGKTYTVGRAREADIVVKDQRASRRHCTLEANPDGEWTVTDHQSSNGTYVNRQRITSHPLREGDILQVGQATFEFQTKAAATPSSPSDSVADAATERLKAEPAPSAASAAKPAAPPASAPKPAPAPAPAPPPKAEPPPHPAPAKAAEAQEPSLDDELKGLFEFLDRIDASERPAASAPKPAPPAAAEPKEEPKGGGGLMDFLRKKKQE
jgi:pSer/pThr/pTyr-binding forkhead associated (FHA) protein